MSSNKEFYVYIMASESKVIYIGYTNDLPQRVSQHKTHFNRGFTDTYHVTKLVYCECYDTALDAIAREKQLKGWRREKKIKLIEGMNPKWEDLGYIDELDFKLLKLEYGKVPLPQGGSRDEEGGGKVVN